MSKEEAADIIHTKKLLNEIKVNAAYSLFKQYVAPLQNKVPVHKAAKERTRTYTILEPQCDYDDGSFLCTATSSIYKDKEVSLKISQHLAKNKCPVHSMLGLFQSLGQKSTNKRNKALPTACCQQLFGAPQVLDSGHFQFTLPSSQRKVVFCFVAFEPLTESLELHRKKHPIPETIRLPLDQVRKVGEKLAEVIQFAHGKQYLVNELLPEYIFQTAESNDWVLTDFSRWTPQNPNLANGALYNFDDYNVYTSNNRLNAKPRAGYEADDYESLLYLLLHLTIGYLQWLNLEEGQDQESALAAKRHKDLIAQWNLNHPKGDVHSLFVVQLLHALQVIASGMQQGYLSIPNYVVVSALSEPSHQWAKAQTEKQTKEQSKDEEIKVYKTKTPKGKKEKKAKKDKREKKATKINQVKAAKGKDEKIDALADALTNV